MIGQVPPPYHGQAVMIASFVCAQHEDLEVDFLPMTYSKTVQDVGRARGGKLVHLARLLASALWRRAVRPSDVVYYPPAGSGAVPLVRDILTLLVLRRLGLPIVFHFHAMGLEDSYRSLNRLARPWFRAAFFEPDACICPAEANRAEVAFLEPRRIAVVPYGIPDVGAPAAVTAARERSDRGSVGGPATILFLGNLIPSKGVWRLLGLAERLRAAQVGARVVLAGASPDDELMQRYREHPAARAGAAVFTGPVYGEEKLALLRSADLFCFPSTYESENLPVVLLEALRAGLPIVASAWRGIPEIVEDGVSGFVVDPDDEDQLVARVSMLLDSPEMRSSMGKAARERYEARFTHERYVRGVDEVLRTAARSHPR